MLDFLTKLLLRFRNGGFILLIFALILFLVWGTFAPVGTLVWWLREGADNLNLQTQRFRDRDFISENVEASPSGTSCYIVFFTGVGDRTGNELSEGETFLLDRLEEEYPHCVTIRDIFPYSAANQDLGGQAIFDFLWDIAEEADGWLELTRYVLETRNVWRMAISADNRYGPIYNTAIALSVAERLEQEQAFPTNPEEPLQLIMIGNSGGPQVALAAAPYLKQWLPVEMYIVSVGGFFDGNDGFDVAQQVYHLEGERDWIDNIAAVIFPARWRWAFTSPFNRARRQGRFIVVNSGPHEHEGDEGYFGTDEATEEGETYVDLTVQKVKQLPFWSETK